jgi:hypothetical protein
MKASPPFRGEISPVLAEAVHEVRQEQRTRAVALLERADVVPLTDGEADDLSPGSTLKSRQYGTPYLIRNVIPGFSASLAGPVSLMRVGSRLLIRAGLFGCGGFLKNPVIVFLPAAPEGVDMQVAAIW